MACEQRIPKVGTRALRRGRRDEAFRIYHLISSTYGRARVFTRFGSARIPINAMRLEHEYRRLESLALVVMPDHFHWLLRLCPEQSISNCINNVKSRSARLVNKRMGASGKLCQKGFYDRAIRHSEDLVAVARYIVANPLRAGLVKSLKDYPHWDAEWL